MKLVLGSFLYNEEHCIEYMLDSVLPFVDGAYILIDDRTNDRTEEICLDYECKTKHFKFENFGKLRNELMAWMKKVSDWHLLLGGDEILDSSSGQILRTTVNEAISTNTDCIGPVRVEWDNLEMSGEPRRVKRDTDTRICNSARYPKLCAKRYFHATLEGCRKKIYASDIIIHHFRSYWMGALNKSVEDKQKFYKYLKELQKKEKVKNIWPDRIN